MSPKIMCFSWPLYLSLQTIVSPNSKSLRHISCWIQCSLFNGVCHGGQTEWALRWTWQLPRGSVARHWLLAFTWLLYTSATTSFFSMWQRRPLVDIIHGCGWLKARIGPQTQDQLCHHCHCSRTVCVFMCAGVPRKKIWRPVRPTCSQGLKPNKWKNDIVCM
jgi:hypothetical protein